MPLIMRVITDLTAAEDAWRHFFAVSNHDFFNRWETRLPFYREFSPRLHFLVAEKNGTPVGFLPLVFAAEIQQFIFFPGELWQGKTWMERNRFFAADAETLTVMLASLPTPYHLRYLLPEFFPENYIAPVDEINYSFTPRDYDFSFANYWQKFSGKTRAKFNKELTALAAANVEFRYDHFPDCEWLFAHNLENFGAYSYFSDTRFLRSFQQLLTELNAARQLRITTVIIANEIAAVDVGAVIESNYAVLAGGVEKKFTGVAKLINLQHLRFACDQKIGGVDFLCGDFGWKERFNFTARELKLLSNYQRSTKEQSNEL